MPFRPILEIRTASLAELLRGRNVDLAALQARASGAMRVDQVSGLTLTLTQRMNDDDVTAPNVVAILPGSDPALRDEYVVFSGHMDHVGIGTPDANGDSIFNGADDDASGTIAVVEIAEAMASLPTAPRRSMMFLLVSGEEKGLWGSEYFADNPSVPTDRMVADFNTDMVGRNWPDTIVAIGKEHSDLGTTLERVNAAHPELRMTAIDDIWPQESFYTRSDHFNFAVKGVPILFFFNGTHEDYHGRDDEPDRIDAEKAARIAQLVFYLGLEVGNAQARPVWNPESYSRIVGSSR
jgi:Zn-dependent M28 family amino/carboxypeptidase